MVDVPTMDMYETLTNLFNAMALKLQVLEAKVSELEVSYNMAVPTEIKDAVKVVADYISK